MIKKHVKTNLLDAKFSYKIHDQVLENMVKIFIIISLAQNR
jgi:hypothetical protein